MTAHKPWELTSPAQTLTSIIEISGATIGDVILARVDVATQEVTGTRRLDPAYGCGDEDSLASYEERRDRSMALCVAARALAGLGPDELGVWRTPSAVLITVVCRAGRVVPTATDLAWFPALRYANHLTDAFNGDVYVVTPHGWISCLHEIAGSEPRIEAAPAPAQPSCSASIRMMPSGPRT